MIMCVVLSVITLYRLKCLLVERCERKIVIALLKCEWKWLIARVASETLGISM